MLAACEGRMWVLMDVLHMVGNRLPFRQDDLSMVWATLSGCSTPIDVVRYALYPLRHWVASVVFLNAPGFFPHILHDLFFW